MDGLPAWAPFLVFLVALAYSSVGHGGASGYLAVLSLFAMPQAMMTTTALVLNILVASIAYLNFRHSKHFHAGLTWPLLLVSVPAAFIGGAIDVPHGVYSLLLAMALLVAAMRLLGLLNRRSPEGELRALSPPAAFLLGGVIGLLSGITGIGGGVFLSPALLLLRWADAKQAAATSACFIMVNSVAGLSARMLAHNADFHLVPVFVLTAFVGGMLGSSLGSRAFSSLGLQRILALVLVTAAVKLML